MAVDTEVVEQQEQEAPPIPLNERPADGPGSGRGDLRKQLEKSSEQERKGREAREAKEAAEPPKRKAKAINNQEIESEAETEIETPEAEGETEKSEEKIEPAPEGLAKEAQAEWNKTPATVRAAVTKRLADSAKGVEELKKRYSDIDQALAPRMDTIRRHGHSPAQAVNQLFAWFEALSANPKQAFPALAQSFKFDLKELTGATPAAQGEPEKQEEVEPWKSEFTGFKSEMQQHLQGLQQQFQQQNFAKTQEILDNWSKGKPYFEDVRQAMAHMIGSGMVPPLPNGAADLDKAYDMALYAMPEVRTKVLEEQEAAKAKAAADKVAKEKAAQQAQADKARRAGSASLRGGAPGDPVQGKKGGKGKSVRESIAEAREELSS